MMNLLIRGVSCGESALVEWMLRLLVSRDFIILPSSPLLWSMLFRSAASALLRTSTEISTLFPVSTVRLVRQSPCYLTRNRPFSVSVCLCKKKQKSLWLQVAEGRTMDGNIEEILAPLRLAVKEQVALTYLSVPSDVDSSGLSQSVTLSLHSAC